MTTIRQWLMKELDDRGLSEKDAEVVLERYLNSDFGLTMVRRMNDDLTGYPPQLLPSVMMGVKRTAVEWIDAECPRHWARPMFTEEVA